MSTINEIADAVVRNQGQFAGCRHIWFDSFPAGEDPTACDPVARKGGLWQPRATGTAPRAELPLPSWRSGTLA